jgi:hypothetical protein
VILKKREEECCVNVNHGLTIGRSFQNLAASLPYHLLCGKNFIINEIRHSISSLLDRLA